MQKIKKMTSRRGRPQAKCLNEVANLMSALKVHDMNASLCLKEAAALNECIATSVSANFVFNLTIINHHPTYVSRGKPKDTSQQTITTCSASIKTDSWLRVDDTAMNAVVLIVWLATPKVTMKGQLKAVGGRSGCLGTGSGDGVEGEVRRGSFG
jgi:hypothetical protein